jgi:hypothetical protein
VPLNAGYEAGAEDAATCGELLAEAKRGTRAKK